MAEEFVWKDPKDIWKGVGIYHLTFNVACDNLKLGTIRGRSKEEIAAVVQPLLDAGEACDASNPKYVAAVKGMAWVELTPFGKAIDNDLRHFQDKHKGTLICARKIMDNHIHVVVWVQKNIKQSIKQIAHGFRIGITHIAKDMGVWPVKVGVEVEAVGEATAGVTPVAQALGNINDPRALKDMNDPCVRTGGNVPMAAKEVVGIDTEACHAEESAGLVLEQAFIRTLARSGQKRSMIDYMILNPYRRWIMVLYPDLFKLHRVTRIVGLKFRSLGNHWLLDWPLRQMGECSRKTTHADWDEQLKGVMERAEAGAVTYTAAMNEGERYIADHIKAAGYPLVLLMKDGFPPVGSEEEKKYKPGGMMSDICSQGRLLLLVAYPESYEDCRIVEMTERSLRQKAEKKGWRYEPLPHSTLRWRSIACNEMMRMLSER